MGSADLEIHNLAREFLFSYDSDDLGFYKSSFMFGFQHQSCFKLKRNFLSSKICKANKFLTRQHSPVRKFYFEGNIICHEILNLDFCAREAATIEQSINGLAAAIDENNSNCDGKRDRQTLSEEYEYNLFHGCPVEGLIMVC